MHRQRSYQAQTRFQQREAEARVRQREAAAMRRLQEAQAEKVHAAIETEQRRTWLKISQFVWLSFGVVEGLIGLRILLKLVAANPNNAFAKIIYDASWLFLWPFLGLTGAPAANGLVLELFSFFALFVYVLASVLVEHLIWIVFSQTKV